MDEDLSLNVEGTSKRELHQKFKEKKAKMMNCEIIVLK